MNLFCFGWGLQDGGFVWRKKVNIIISNGSESSPKLTLMVPTRREIDKTAKVLKNDDIFWGTQTVNPQGSNPDLHSAAN